MSNNEHKVILVDKDDQYRKFCDDHGNYTGCGQEIVLRKNARDKWIACEPVQLPCMDNDGNTVWVWVPHWITCSEQKDYLAKFMTEKSVKNLEYKKSTDSNSINGRF